MRHTSRKTIVNAKQCTLLNQHIKPTHCRRYRGVNATPRIGTIKQHVLAVALTIVCALCFSSISAAATNGPQQTRTYHLDLPEQTVATALNSLSEQTDIQVLFPLRHRRATQKRTTTRPLQHRARPRAPVARHRPARRPYQQRSDHHFANRK